VKPANRASKSIPASEPPIEEAERHIYWMRKALAMAKEAAVMGEVPVASLLVSDRESLRISSAHNRREALTNPLAHAEILSIHRASQALQNWRLEDLTLYVTLEPCLMCAGAILQSRIKRVVFAARDEKAGAVRSLYELFDDQRLNHQVEVVEGVLAAESQALLKTFFKELRVLKKHKGKA